MPDFRPPNDKPVEVPLPIQLTARAAARNRLGRKWTERHDRFCIHVWFKQGHITYEQRSAMLAHLNKSTPAHFRLW